MPARQGRTYVLTADYVASSRPEVAADFAPLAGRPMHFNPLNPLKIAEAKIGDWGIEGYEAAARLNFTHLMTLAVGAVMNDDFAADPKAIPDMVA